MTLKHKIAIIADEIKEPYLISSIQNACRNKQAFCFGTPHARLVLRPMSDNGIPYVVIWLAVSTEPDSIRRYLDEIKTLTRLIGGRWAEFYTARRGFIRLARHFGWQREADDAGLLKFIIPI